MVSISRHFLSITIHPSASTIQSILEKTQYYQAAYRVGRSSYVWIMSRKDKISFIMTSRDTSHVYRDLKELQDRELDDLVRNIVKRLVIESNLIAHMYISDVKIFPN